MLQPLNVSFAEKKMMLHHIMNDFEPHPPFKRNTRIMNTMVTVLIVAFVSILKFSSGQTDRVSLGGGGVSCLESSTSSEQLSWYLHQANVSSP